MRDPMRYTPGRAAKATGKSKTTIQPAISKGAITATKDDSGSYSIAPSELHRAFPRVTPETDPSGPQMDTTRPLDELPQLRARIDALEAMLAREREALDELRSDRDAWKQQATKLLTAPPKRRNRWTWAN